MSNDDEYTPPARRTVARRAFAEGAVEGIPGAQVTSVDDEPVTDTAEDTAEVSPAAAPPLAPPAEGETAGGGIRGGWGASQKTFDANSPFVSRFAPGTQAQIIKFLEDKPYAAYARHWVDRVTSKGKSTIPVLCLESVDKDCPLCNVGDRPQAVSAFNVALLDDDGSVSLKSWDVGVKIFKILQTHHNDQKVGPLTKRFFVVQTSGTGQQKSTTAYPLSAASLAEDYDIQAPSEQELKSLGLYDASIVEIPKTKDLTEMALEISQDD